MHRRSLPSLLALCGLLMPVLALADERSTLTVGTSEFAPLSTDGSSDTPEGFDIDVMREAGRRMGKEVRFHHYLFGELIPAIERGEIDAAISGMTITREREVRIDFTHPYLDTGLAILVRSSRIKNASVFDVLTSGDFLLDLGRIVGALVAYCILLGLFLWATLRKGTESIHEAFYPGIFDGMWLCLVTITTVGYGDVVPKSRRGRLCTALVMFSGTIFYSVVAGTIASLMTVQRLKSDVATVRDLHGERVATVRDTTSEAHVRDARTKAVLTDDVTDAIRLLEARRVDAVVFDAPALEYYAHHDNDGSTTVVGSLFDRQSYGIALPAGSALRERFNDALLAMRQDGTIDRLRERWFGKDSLQ